MAGEENQEEQFEVKPRPDASAHMDFAQLERMILLDLKTYPYQIDHRFIGKYTKDDIKNYLLTPEIFTNQVQLRYISKYLHNVSNHYKRLVQYFSSMLKFDYVIEPYDLNIDKINVDRFKKMFWKSVNLVESMNVKHEFSRVLSTAFRDDVFFGYIHMSKDSFYIQQLDADYCKISSIEDGVYNFAFDFNYFGVYPNRLHMYPQEFIDKWNLYKNDSEGRWQELDPKMTICIKINENIDYYPIPPFVGVFGNLLDIEDFKELRKTRAEIGNYKLITQKIPVREDSGNNNDYIITYPHAVKFHNNIAKVLPEQIGLATTPMKLELLDFERDKPDINNVAQAESEYWSTAGVSQLLFTGDSGTIAMNYSIIADETIVFKVLRQLERWLNRFLKFYVNNTQYKFRVCFLDTTYFNSEDELNKYIEAATYGVSGTKSRIVAALGMEPSTIVNMAFLENEILSLHESWIPMQSSHTQSGDDPTATGGSGSKNGGGRPKKKDKDLSTEGAKTRDKKGNDNRAKK